MLLTFKSQVAAFAAWIPLALAAPNITHELPYVRSFFDAGGEYVSDGAGGHIYHNQMYVEKLSPVNGPNQSCPIVFIHGQAQTGTVGYPLLHVL